MNNKYRVNSQEIRMYLLDNIKEYNKVYPTFPLVFDANEHIVRESLYEASRKLAVHFNFLDNQIVMLGMVDNKGDIRYEYPVIVTKVHIPDEDGNNTYNYIHYMRGNCEFISSAEETERYMWRFCTKSKIPNWFLEIVESWVFDEDDESVYQFDKEKINFIENNKIYFPFKKGLVNDK